MTLMQASSRERGRLLKHLECLRPGPTGHSCCDQHGVKLRVLIHYLDYQISCLLLADWATLFSLFHAVNMRGLRPAVTGGDHTGVRNTAFPRRLVQKTRRSERA
jgi:hypothetical protein